jgi:hypothetical protein
MRTPQKPSAPGFRRAVSVLALAAILAGCQSASMESTTSTQSAAESTQLGYAAELPKLTCAAYGNPGGRGQKLTAKRVKVGDPAYIEFRVRPSPTTPTSGHLYVVFGRLDAQGNVQTRQYIGLFPDGGPLGLTVGSVVPMPADLLPGKNDCTYSTTAAYRVSLTEDQYQRLLGKVRAYLANPPKWRMFGFNCNNFAATLGEVAGLHEPGNTIQPSFTYIHAYIKENGDA